MQGADQFAREFRRTTDELFLHQHIRQPTRHNKLTASILDLVFTPNKSDILLWWDMGTPIGNSGHAVVKLEWTRGRARTEPEPDRKPNIWCIDFSKMAEAVKQIGWFGIETTIDGMWHDFKQNL